MTRCSGFATVGNPRHPNYGFASMGLTLLLLSTSLAPNLSHFGPWIFLPDREPCRCRLKSVGWVLSSCPALVSQPFYCPRTIHLGLGALAIKPGVCLGTFFTASLEFICFMWPKYYLTIPTFRFACFLTEITSQKLMGRRVLVASEKHLGCIYT